MIRRTRHLPRHIGVVWVRGLVAVERHARDHICSRLLLRVNRQNQPAIDAYLRYGFTVATLIVEDIGGGYVMDDYVMMKELQPA